MSTVEGKKQEKRRALLDAAYELFLERGTAKTSVEDITSRAKVAKGTFYLYFQDKGAVMQALLGRVSYQLLNNACEAVERQTGLETFPDKMVAMIDHIIEALRRAGFPVSKADNDVLDGIRVTANLLKQRKIVICEDCGSCLEEIAGYCWEDGGTGHDRPKKERDHAMDEMRYFAVSIAKKERGSGIALRTVERTAR